MVEEEEVLMMEVVLTENILMTEVMRVGVFFGGGRGRGRVLTDRVGDGA